MSGAEIVWAFQRLGFEKLRQSGSHVVMRRGGEGCVIPLHAEVKVGTLASILRQAEVTTEEFLSVL
jgi:predicted RNA binding protein YcfA (HicA-like mRNA interferase family)